MWFKSFLILVIVGAIWTLIDLAAARASRQFGNIRKHLESVGQDWSAAHAVPFCMAVVGRERSLIPRVEEELFKITTEAMLNAFQHAKAKSIHAKLQFARSRFRIVISDDGVGIEGSILSYGQHGDHCGLVEMRTRADRIGAAFRIDSDRKVGTCVQIEMDARCAYASRRLRFSH